MDETDTQEPVKTDFQNSVRSEVIRYCGGFNEPSNIYRKIMEDVEKELLEVVMDKCNGNQSKAAKWLGISRGNLRGKMVRHDLTDTKQNIVNRQILTESSI